MTDWFERWFGGWRSLGYGVLVVAIVVIVLLLVMEFAPGKCDDYEGTGQYQACVDFYNEQPNMDGTR